MSLSISLPYHIISKIGNQMDRRDQSTFAQLNKFFADEFSQNNIGLSIPRKNASMIRKCIKNINIENFTYKIIIKNSFKPSFELQIMIEQNKFVFILVEPNNNAELPDVIGIYRFKYGEKFKTASEHMFECIKKNKRNKLNKIISYISDIYVSVRIE